MSAWAIHDTQAVAGPPEVLSLKTTHRGPHVAAVEAKCRIVESDVTVTYALRTGESWLDIAIHADWLEVGGPEVGTPALRFVLPLAFDDAPAGAFEIPYGSIERGENDGQDVPALRWADVRGTVAGADAGLTLANDSRYGHSVSETTLGVTLLRSSYSPDPWPEVGAHDVRLAAAPYAGKRPVADMVRLGAAINHPLAVVATDVHAGGLPAEVRGVEVGPADVILTAVKVAEDRDGIVLRLQQTAGRAANAKVTLDPTLFGTVADAVEVDLMEQPVAQSTAKVARTGTVSVRVPARGIASVRVRFA
jgi:alpha-mannosidase